MPVIAPNVVQGRVQGTWRNWTGVNVKRSGTWVPAKFVWAFVGFDAPKYDMQTTGANGGFAALRLAAVVNSTANGNVIPDPGVEPSQEGDIATGNFNGQQHYFRIEATGTVVWTDVDPTFTGINDQPGATYLGQVLQPGEWRLIWANAPSAPVSATATLQGDGKVAVAWTSNTPEAADKYEVRRSDGSLVAILAATGSGSLFVAGDSTPLPGTNAYTITAFIGTVAGTPETTNTVSIDLTPDTATATFNTSASPNRAATISWTGSKPGTVSFKVYRPNGTLVGTVSSPSLQIVDASPTPNTNAGRYRVDAIGLNGTVGGSIETNAVTIAITPPSGSLSDNDGDTIVVVNWSASVGEHTGFNVYRDSTLIASVAQGATTYTYTVPNSLRGLSMRFFVAATINGAVSTQRDCGLAVINPGAPVSMTGVATGVLKQLRFTWGAPTGFVNGYEFQYSENGSTWTASSDDTSPVTITFTGTSGPKWGRVRSLGNGGGVSGWSSFSATPLYDNTPPALPTITGLKPESSYGRLVLRGTTSSSDNNQYEISRSINDGAWSVVRSWTSIGNSTAFSYVMTGSSGAKYEFRVRVRDQYGNTSGYTPVVYYRLKPATQTLLASYTNHFRQGTWNYLGNLRPYQGYFSNPSFIYTGLIAYGENTIRDTCRADSSFGGTLSIQSMKITLVRSTAGIGNFEVSVYMGTTATYGAVGTPSVQAVSNMGTLQNQGVAKQFTLTSGQRNNLVAGGASGRSIGFYTNSTQYLAFPSVAENALNGALAIASLG